MNVFIVERSDNSSEFSYVDKVFKNQDKATEYMSRCRKDPNQYGWSFLVNEYEVFDVDEGWDG